VKAFIENDVAVKGMNVKSSSLEDYFLKILNEGAVIA